MPRSGAEARGRLEAAAFDLFLERGFDAVTTAEIAERAGVTERTYFRHFADKREVLFDGELRLSGWVEEAVRRVPEAVAPFATVRRVIDDIVPRLEANRVESGRLGRIIAATPALAERAAAKEAHLVAQLTAALVGRGADPDEAAVAARTAWGVLAHAMTTWRADSAADRAADPAADAAGGVPGSLATHVDRAFAVLAAVVAAS